MTSQILVEDEATPEQQVKKLLQSLNKDILKAILLEEIEDDKEIRDLAFLSEFKTNIEKTMQKKLRIYLSILKQYVRRTPKRVEVHIRPDKMVMFVYDEFEEEMQLKGNGQVQCFKSVILNQCKIWTMENRKRGINQNITTFYL